MVLVECLLLAQNDSELYPRWKEDRTYTEGDWIVEEGRFLVLLAAKPKWLARNMMIAPGAEVRPGLAKHWTHICLVCTNHAKQMQRPRATGHFTQMA